MTENWGQIQGKWDLVRVSGGVQLPGFYCIYMSEDKLKSKIILTAEGGQRLDCRNTNKIRILCFCTQCFGLKHKLSLGVLTLKNG